LIPVIFAQDATGSGGVSSLIFLVVMVAVFWLFIIRPQRNRAKKQQELASSLQVGDEIQTIGGIKGRVASIDGDDLVVDVEEGRLRITRRAVASRVGDTAAPEAPTE
jgi:preprotein translocase subunit YajC